MCTKKSLRRKIEEKDATIMLYEDRIRELKERLSKFERKRGKGGRFTKQS